MAAKVAVAFADTLALCSQIDGRPKDPLQLYILDYWFDKCFGGTLYMLANVRSRSHLESIISAKVTMDTAQPRSFL
jgi:hypothetical protein